MAKKQALGFGFIPTESQHHFLVSIPRNQDQEVVVHERFAWQDDDEEQSVDVIDKRLKVIISKHKWKHVEDSLKQEFNFRLKKENIVIGKFKIGQNPVERLLGKEMVLLLWAIEDSDPSIIPNAIKNWLGLSREERWWLFTMTNAVTGHADDKRGWRKAIRYALTENPIEESNQQGHILEMLYKNV